MPQNKPINEVILEITQDGIHRQLPALVNNDIL